MASMSVAQLERSEALLMSQLAVPVTEAAHAPAESPEISFDNKETRNEDVRREIDAAIEGLNTADRWKEFLDEFRATLLSHRLDALPLPERGSKQHADQCEQQRCDERVTTRGRPTALCQRVVVGLGLGDEAVEDVVRRVGHGVAAMIRLAWPM